MCYFMYRKRHLKAFKLILFRYLWKDCTNVMAIPHRTNTERGTVSFGVQLPISFHLLLPLIVTGQFSDICRLVEPTHGYLREDTGKVLTAARWVHWQPIWQKWWPSLHWWQFASKDAIPTMHIHSCTRHFITNNISNSYAHLRVRPFMCASVYCSLLIAN